MKKMFLVGVAALAACAGGAPVSLSARVGTSAATPPSRAASGGLVVAEGITLDRARVVLRRLKVERHSESMEVEISQGPLLIDVSGDALGGAVQQLVETSIPAGTYDELKIAVHAVTVAPAGAPAGFADLVARRASILLEGTVDGQPFTFASGLEAELEREGQFTVGGSAANITINLDPTAWFKDSAGARLDPTDAAQRAAIEANIRASFSAFQDDDEEGHEDHHDGADGGDDHGDHSGPGDGGSPDAGDDHGGSPGSDDGGGHH